MAKKFFSLRKSSGMPSPNRKKVYAFTIGEKKIITSFDSVAQAATAYGVRVNAISAAIRTGRIMDNSILSYNNPYEAWQ
jgi:hypothetical protein